MNNLTTEIILDTTTVGTPSGNYDGSTDHFISDPVEGVAYYLGRGSIQTVYIRVTGFEGKITIQGTLGEIADESAWCDLYLFDSASSVITDYHPEAILGNFTWMRAVVTEFNSGTIDSVTVTY
jgi:hypothetical protein